MVAIGDGVWLPAVAEGVFSVCVCGGGGGELTGSIESHVAGDLGEQAEAISHQNQHLGVI